MNQQFQKITATADDSYTTFFDQKIIDRIYRSIPLIVAKSCPNKPVTTVPKDQIQIQMWEVYSKEYNHQEIMAERVTYILANQVIEQYQNDDLIGNLDPDIMLMDQSFGITAYDQRSIKLNHKKYNNVDYEIRR